MPIQFNLADFVGPQALAVFLLFCFIGLVAWCKTVIDKQDKKLDKCEAERSEFFKSYADLRETCGGLKVEVEFMKRHLKIGGL